MKNFTIIKNELMDKSISDGGFRLYCMLESYCYGKKISCFPSQETLGNRLKKSVRTVQRYIDELHKVGLIEIKRRGSISNIYIMTTKDVSEEVSETVESIKKKAKFYSKTKKDTFSNYTQRKYDFPKLERALLGIDRNVNYEDLYLD